jgi:hypothetical protein
LIEKRIALGRVWRESLLKQQLKEKKQWQHELERQYGKALSKRAGEQ